MNSGKKSAFLTVVAFSDEETVRACLKSLLSQELDRTKYDLIFRVLINDKIRIPPDNLKSDFPEFQVAAAKHNLGYAGAIQNSWMDGRGEIIIVTNDDLTFRPGWLQGLLEPFDDPEVFATTCSIVNEGEPEEGANGSLNPIGIRIPDIFTDRSKVLFPSGAAFAFRRDEVEPVDASYFLYFEDVYLGLLARLRGLDIRMNPNSVADHKHRLSTSQMPLELLHYFQEKNRIANIFMFFSGLTLLKLTPYLIADLLIRIGQMVSFKRRPDAILRVWFYYLTHVGTTLSRRFKIAKLRRIKDSELLPFMSGNLLPDGGKFVKALNKCFLWYARLVGLNFAEFMKK